MRQYPILLQIKTIVLLVISIFCFAQSYSQSENLLTSSMNHSLHISNDLPINYLENGEGPTTIIMIHGLGSNKKSWLKLIRELGSDYRTIALDIPKYLHTDSTQGIQLTQYADNIRELMDSLHISSAIICGHSMGGQIAMHFSLKYPTKVEQLILLAPAGLETFSKSDHQFFNRFATKKFYTSQTKEQITASFDINFYGSHLPEDAEFMLEDRKKLMKDTLRYSRYLDYVVASVQSMLHQTVHSQLSEIQQPTLVIFGQHDLLIPNKVIHPKLTIEKVIHEATVIPSSKTIILQKAGHFVMWDQAEKVAEEINQFLKEYKPIKERK